MNKFIKKSVVLAALITGLVFATQIVSPTEVDAYVVEQKLINKGYTGTNSLQDIVLHEAGNPNNTGANSLDNEVAFMSRNWYNANAHYFVGSGGRVVQLLRDNDLGYHAGSWANGRAIGIELARTNNQATFNLDYHAYVDLTRNLAGKYGIPLTLDAGFGKGIKSHLWVSNNVWGDHADPYDYLASFGVTRAKLAHDLANGFGGAPQQPSKPVPPTKPTQPSGNITVGSTVTVKSAINYDTGGSFYASGDYNVIEVKSDRAVIGKGQVVTSAINVSNLQLKGGAVAPSKPAPKPQPAKPKPTPTATGFVAENGTFTPYSAVNVRTGTSTASTRTGTIYNPTSIRYNAYKVDNGYVWIRYDSFNGVRYMAVRPVGGAAFGTFQ